MATITTGRRLDEAGRPIEGTGFDYDSDDRLATLFGQRVSPLLSQPVTREWVFALVLSNQTSGEFERGVGIFTPGNAGPPEHFHPVYEEHFDIIAGDFVFRIDGKECDHHAGDQLVVRIRSPHTFRCVGKTLGVIIVETRPAARIGTIISTLFGMAHEGKLTPQGQPKFLQAMTIGSELADDTVITSPPPSIVLPLAKILAPFARWRGYSAAYPRYAEESFWKTHVEQPQ